MNFLNLLAQQPDNQTKTTISSSSFGIILAIIFIVLLVIIIFVAFKCTGTKNNSEDEGKKKKHITVGVFVTIFCLFLTIGVPLILITNTNDSSSKSPSLTTRNIRKSDYTYTTSQNLTSYSITIVPELDFKTCTVELILYNSQNEKIFADTITKSNLKKNSSYTYTFQFGFINSLSGDSITFEVTGKCSIFQ